MKKLFRIFILLACLFQTPITAGPTGRYVDPAYILALAAGYMAMSGDASYLQNEFYDAVRSRDIGAIRAVHEAGINLNALNADGETALHMAIAAGQYAIADELLQLGASLETPNESGQTPMELSVLLASTTNESGLLNPEALLIDELIQAYTNPEIERQLLTTPTFRPRHEPPTDDIFAEVARDIAEQRVMYASLTQSDAPGAPPRRRSEGGPSAFHRSPGRGAAVARVHEASSDDSDSDPDDEVAAALLPPGIRRIPDGAFSLGPRQASAGRDEAHGSAGLSLAEALAEQAEAEAEADDDFDAADGTTSALLSSVFSGNPTTQPLVW